MISAMFGTKKFEVSNKKIYTPDGLNYSEELNIEETEVSGKKPTVKIKGVKLMSLDFDVKLDARFVDVKAEIDFWHKTMKGRESQSFKLGSRVLGVFYLTKINMNSASINKNGAYTSAILSLSFLEDGTKVNEKESIKAEASTTKKKPKKVKKGSTIKPNKNVRWYETADSAIKKSGKSGKAYQQDMTVTHIYKKGGKIVCVNAEGLGWLKVEDVTVVK